MRGQTETITGPGGAFDVYRSEPAGTPRGAIVVIQEIFGVNAHIRSLADRFAAIGLAAYAPALFDRQQKGVDIGYTPEDIDAGRKLMRSVDWDGAMADIAATVTRAAERGPVAVVGYCWGGGLAYAAGCTIDGVAAAIGYYGGPWGRLLDLVPRCPTLMHFGAKDKGVPVELAAEYKARHPAIVTHVYDADHGFNCDQRGVYDGYAAQRALERTHGLIDAIC